MPFADDLLEQAQFLAKRDKKRPRQASLRRALSTAYYALFHLLTTAAVASWKTPRQRAALARHFTHARMNDACAKTRGRKFPNPNHASVRHLRAIANAFVELQQYRHAADYDNSKKWTRTEVLTHLELAAEAFESWNAIAKEPIAEDFLLQLLIGVRPST
jgi:uncharacterized protein (UPF0332 family)